MASITWGRDLAEIYDATYSAQFEPSALDPMLGLLVDLARDGRVLEFAIDTGRVALPLAARGVRVDAVELFIYVVSTDPTHLARAWHRFADSAIGRAFTTASTLLGVAALGYADQLVELELTAVRSGGPGVGAGER